MKPISELLPELMKAVGNIGKDRFNDHQRYNFRGIDDVLNHVGPACAQLAVRVQVTLHDYVAQLRTYVDQGKEKYCNHVSLRMRLEFFAPDGSSHISEACGEGVDTNGDKATNKAMSAAFKYACFMGLVIPVAGALDDSDNDPKQPDRDASQGQPPRGARGSRSNGRGQPPPVDLDQATIGKIRNLMDELAIDGEREAELLAWATKKNKEAAPREGVAKIADLIKPEAEKLIRFLEKKIAEQEPAAAE